MKEIKITVPIPEERYEEIMSAMSLAIGYGESKESIGRTREQLIQAHLESLVAQWCVGMLHVGKEIQNTGVRPIVDRGFGDTLARWFKKIGVIKKDDCGCDKRQAFLNRIFPYGNANTHNHRS
jgi:galactose-1-phosphate uridylyltransferase